MSKKIKSIEIFEHDLSSTVERKLLSAEFLGIDTETSGLDFIRNDLLLVQIADCHGNVYMVRRPDWHSQRLKTLLEQGFSRIIFHCAAFDLKFLKAGIGLNLWHINESSLDCTKTLMKILHPNQSSGLKTALRTNLGVSINKKIDHSRWDREELSDEQKQYAANDVIYLPRLLKQLKTELNKQDLERHYMRAVNAMVNKAFLEVEGFSDLLEYEQDKASVRKKQREWWNKKTEKYQQEVQEKKSVA